MVKLSVVDVRRAGRHIAIASVTGKDILTATTVDTPPVAFTLGNQSLPILGEFTDLVPGGDRKAGAILKIKHLLVVQRRLHILVNTVKFDTLAELARTVRDIVGSHAGTMAVADGILKIPVKWPVGNQALVERVISCDRKNLLGCQCRNLVLAEGDIPYCHIIYGSQKPIACAIINTGASHVEIES